MMWYYIHRCSLLLPTEQRGLSVCHTSEPCKNGCTNRDAVWVEDSGGPRNHVLDGGPDSAMGRGNFEGGKGRSIVKYRDTPRSSVQNGLTDQDGIWVMGSDGP